MHWWIIVGFIAGSLSTFACLMGMAFYLTSEWREDRKWRREQGQ